jgi:hypothetical protein
MTTGKKVIKKIEKLDDNIGAGTRTGTFQSRYWNK